MPRHLAAVLTVSALAFPGIALADCSPLATPPQGSPAIVMSQIGFETGGPKTAILRTRSDAPAEWVLRAPGGKVVARGETVPYGENPSSGDAVHRISLPRDLPPGEGYLIETCGTTSRTFAVGDEPYKDLATDLLTYFYHNRSGVPIEAEYVQGDEYARAAGFENEVNTCISGRDRDGHRWPGCDYSLDVTGSWFDAGDYGKYVVNGGIAVWTLQDAAARLMEDADWADGRAPMPEAGNGISDVLDEARVGLEFLLAMQVPDGAEVAVLVDGQKRPQVIDAGGLVHHKTHEREWLPLPQVPAEATAERFLLPPTTAATLNMAAAAAQGARLWADIDPDFSARALAAARTAYDAAKAHPAIYAPETFNGGGAYGDRTLADEFAWAVAELYAATGDEAYRADLFGEAETAAGWAEAYHAPTDISWGGVGALAPLALYRAGEAVPAEVRDAAAEVIVRGADTILKDREDEGYAYPFPRTGYVWGSSGSVANRGILLATAHDITGEEKYRDGAVDLMEFLLGRNALDQSFISGYGARAMTTPHHRFWAHGADPSFPAAPPGAVSGGPNDRNPADEPARRIAESCTGQRCWVDDVDSYSMNEVAINWNAPAFWLASYLETTEPAAD